MVLQEKDIRHALRVCQRTLLRWRKGLGTKKIIPLPYQRELNSGKPIYDADQFVRWLETFRPRQAEYMKQYIAEKMNGKRKQM